jgi:hypothetical protein
MSLPGNLSAISILEMDTTQCAAFVAPDPDIAGIGVTFSRRRKIDFSFEYSYLLSASSSI